MLAVMGLASVLTLVALTALFFSQQAVTGMERSINTQTAFQAADAGIDRALARLNANPTTSLGWPLVDTVGGAAYSVTATLTPGPSMTTYNVTSVGTFDGLTQTVSQQYTQSVVPAFSMWDKYMFPDAGFNAVNGWSTTNIWGSVYTAGDVSIKDLGGLPANVASRAFTNSVYVYNGQCYIKKGVDSTYASDEPSRERSTDQTESHQRRQVRHVVDGLPDDRASDVRPRGTAQRMGHCHGGWQGPVVGALSDVTHLRWTPSHDHSDHADYHLLGCGWGRPDSNGLSPAETAARAC